MRFVLFKGQGQYGSLRLHADQLAAALVELGHEARRIDLAADGWVDEVNSALADPPDCFFGFSGMGVGLQTPDNPVFDRSGAVFASIYVDHPLHHVQRLTTPVKKKVAFFLDRTHVQFMTAWGQAPAFRQIGFLPCGANELGSPPDTSDEAFAARDIPLLFTGTYRGDPVRAWADWPDSPARTLIEQTAERMAADGRLPALDALKQTLSQLGVELNAETFEQLLPLLQTVQSFAEAYHRDRLLHVLGAAGTPVRVYGLGWQAMADRYPGFDYGGEGSFQETLHLLRQARLVLNTNNGFVAGGHERVFTAMCAGAGVISDQSRYYAEAFKEGREIATFTWSELDKVPGQIEGLLADEAALAAMARAGTKKAMAEHRWTDRAAKLAKAVRQAK
ncbi:glycosyltransferase [Phenylobacterium sp.]|uniref:glycosyltransferase family protein n=1 Tax=Phenylobacterium sp. TaxID=1871053 RepID=UPI0035C78B4E